MARVVGCRAFRVARVVGCSAFRVARVVGCRAWGSRERPEAPPPPGRHTGARHEGHVDSVANQSWSHDAQRCEPQQGMVACAEEGSASVFSKHILRRGREGTLRRREKGTLGTRAMLAPRPRRGGSEARERVGGGGEGAGAGAGARHRGDARAEYRGSHLHVMPMARARKPSRDAGVTRASECVVGCAGTRGGSCAAEHSLSLARSEGGESTDV